MKYYLKTYGCQMNVHDSEKIAGILSESGYGTAEEVKNADVVVLNTCNIRQKAEQKLYSDLGRLKKIKKNRPGLKIAVAGCIAQQSGGDLFRRFPHINFIFGPSNIDSLQRWINTINYKSPEPEILNPKSEIRITDLGDNEEYYLKNLPMKREGRVKAWVSIMYGCDNFCAYCVVPYTRGMERSRPVRDILSETRKLAGEGYKEITLLGQNVNSYGKKSEEHIDFPDLLKALHEVKGIERIRFVTSHPRDFSRKLVSVLKDLPKVCEHLHLPIQSGSDRILNLMNRGYTYNKYKEKIGMLRDAIPDAAITTDIIAGFPGETEEDFQQTITALKEIEFDGVFAFKYSKRPDTKALELPGHIDEETKSMRLAHVLDLQDSITYKKNRTLEGKTFEILVEGISETDRDKLTGRTRTNKIVNYHGDQDDTGTLVDILVLEAKRHSLFGEKI
jgi:tRNA-2-methylthio-N6-dimethylallyladenosine synthase